jgi:phage terminase Nu1 subunit (DNA packaging protein)
MLGVSQQSVSVMVEAGILPRGSAAGTWLTAYCHRIREQAAGRMGAADGGLDLVQERALLSRQHRILAEMKVAEERGSLIRVDAVKTAFATAFSNLREGLLQIPTRLSPLLAADSDQASVHNALHAEIHQALMQLSGAADRLDAERKNA